MPELAFSVLGAEAVADAATPQIALRVALSATPAELWIDSVLLRCAVRIDAGARQHEPSELGRVRELFGDESAWGRAARSLLWTQTTSVVTGFRGQTQIEIALLCSYDLAAHASKYLHGLSAGDVPVRAQFSGTVFYQGAPGLQVAQIPWDREASYRLPLALFRQVIDAHFPNAGVLSLRRDLFERLDRYRTARGLASFDAALEQLLGTGELRGAP